MPALRRKRRRFPSSTARRIGRKGETPVLPPFRPCRCPVFPPALSIRQTFQVFNLNRASSSTDCQTTYSPSACMPSPVPECIITVAPFSAKAAHRLPRQSARKRFSPGYLFCQPFISQNLRIILTHNHRRRCGNDFIADARSARFPQIFCQIFNR